MLVVGIAEAFGFANSSARKEDHVVPIGATTTMVQELLEGNIHLATTTTTIAAEKIVSVRDEKSEKQCVQDEEELKLASGIGAVSPVEGSPTGATQQCMNGEDLSPELMAGNGVDQHNVQEQQQMVFQDCLEELDYHDCEDDVIKFILLGGVATRCRSMGRVRMEVKRLPLSSGMHTSRRCACDQ